MKRFSLLLLFTTFATIYAGEKYLTVHVATWNVNEKNPPGDLDKFLGLLPEKAEERPDIVLVGLQEVTMSISEAVTNYFQTDKWSQSIDDTLTNKRYVKIKKASLVGVVLNAFVKLEHAWTLEDVDVDRVMTGLGGYSPNKGGIIIKYKLFTKNFCIINAHFHAHDKDLEKRIKDFARINARRDQLCNFKSDYIFWMGDLNFRIENPEYTENRIQSMIEDGKLDELLEKDQLLVTRKTGNIFDDYKEAPITFAPTYKMVVGEDRYDLKRRPAWTDRVLYKSETDREITPILYKSVKSYTISDHHPVQAQFKISIDVDKIYSVQDDQLKYIVYLGIGSVLVITIVVILLWVMYHFMKKKRQSKIKIHNTNKNTKKNTKFSNRVNDNFNEETKTMSKITEV